jgi:hypothetical protein
VNLRRDYGDPLKLQFEPAPSGDAGEADTAADAPPAYAQWSADEQTHAAAQADAAADAAVRAAQAAPGAEVHSLQD